MGLCMYKNAWFENDIKSLYYILNKEWDHCETGWSRYIHAHNVMVFTHAAHWSSNHVLANEKFSTSPAEQLDIPINIPTPVVLIDAAECGSTTIKTSSIAQLRYWQWNCWSALSVRIWAWGLMLVICWTDLHINILRREMLMDTISKQC